MGINMQWEKKGVENKRKGDELKVQERRGLTREKQKRREEEKYKRYERRSGIEWGT